MTLCVVVGAVVAHLAVETFTLAWTHSVERTDWQEEWRIDGERLVLVSARVKGSGAGMEPGPDAVAEDGWWRWRPHRSVPSLTLARSPAVPDWRLCVDGDCRAVTGPGASTDVVKLRPCP